MSYYEKLPKYLVAIFLLDWKTGDQPFCWFYFGRRKTEVCNDILHFHK